MSVVNLNLTEDGRSLNLHGQLEPNYLHSYSQEISLCFIIWVISNMNMKKKQQHVDRDGLWTVWLSIVEEEKHVG